MKNLDQLKTFSDASKLLKLDPKKVIPDFKNFPTRDRKAMVAHAKLVVIARAANKIGNGGKEWKPDWSNPKQYKYYPWFYLDGGSSGFRFYDCDYWHSFSLVGSRLCFVTPDVSEYVAKQFIDLYKAYFLIK